MASPTTDEVKIHPNKEAFIEGVDHVLSKWTALELAVQNGWGGRNTLEKRENMVDEIVEYFDLQVRKKNTTIEPTEVEELLVQVMEEDFSVMLEDQSEKQVARLLCSIFAECRAGNFATVDKMAEEKEARGNGADNAASRSQAAQRQRAAGGNQDASSGSDGDSDSDSNDADDNDGDAIMEG
ncbi:rRNA accumulation- protein [Coemansia sp. RSA 2559]|nr:rRNA accumulation- protein [Coemansia sp. RSA 2559]KAJ2866581.1 rRNA accumulation- protein [Coemansia erecta]